MEETRLQNIAANIGRSFKEPEKKKKVDAATIMPIGAKLLVTMIFRIDVFKP